MIPTIAVSLALLVMMQADPPAAAEPDRAARLRSLDGRVLPAEGDGSTTDRSRMLARDVRARVQEANLRENAAWEAVTSRAEWEAFRDRRVQALRRSLGPFPEAGGVPRVLVARTLEGDGYRVEDLAFESRPGLVVTANLYGPAAPRGSMPGILISHSHHNPKTEGELQDMGMTWARQGCLVLVMDHLGHGERRQHPFRSSGDFPRPFRVGRQDYDFRYNLGVQLQLAGESLMGWLVGDLLRGLDLLAARPGVDADRLIVLGSVAGGGDPAGVAAALDPRIKAVVPFNFGGTQPDYAVPADPARDFYFFGVPGWESTRCLRLGARDGFAHWLIVASVAPRRLVYAHEFAWDPGPDPAWPRIRRVFDWYGAGDHLAVVTGRGNLRGTPPESSHCNNIGPLHRDGLYPALARWFGMVVPAEYSRRRPAADLLCMTPEVVRELRPRPVHELAAEAGAGKAAAMARELAGLDPRARRERLRREWARLLGDVGPAGEPTVLARETLAAVGAAVERIALEVEPGIVVPLLLIRPPARAGARLPVVLGLAHEGKRAFLEQRSGALAELLDGGAAVCLADVRGTGETRPRDGSRRHNGGTTALSAAEWMLGRTLVGARLRDLRSVLVYLRGRGDVDTGRVALWGDSFSPPNPRDADLAVPMDADPFPRAAEPLGGLLALLGALTDDGIRAVFVRGGLAGYGSLLESPFLYVLHDAIVPGAVAAGDLGLIAAALAPRPLRLEGLVDGLNREVAAGSLATSFGAARASYDGLAAGSRLELVAGEAPSRPAPWLLRALRED